MLPPLPVLAAPMGNLRGSNLPASKVSSPRQESQQGTGIREPLGQVSNNLPRKEVSANPVAPPQRLVPPRVEDPWFVLGVGKDAIETE